MAKGEKTLCNLINRNKKSNFQAILANTKLFFFKKVPWDLHLKYIKCNYRHFPSLSQWEYNVMLGYIDQNIHSKTYHLNTPIITLTHTRITNNQLMYVAVLSSQIDVPISTEQTAWLITHKIQFQIRHCLLPNIYEICNYN